MSTTPEHGAIACGHDLTAEAARAMLEDGGNAVDAAIAAAAMACVVEPVLAGPAGGGFAMVRPAGHGEDATPQLCDFFCQTPRRRNPDAHVESAIADFGDATQTFHIGPGTTATPGFIHGLSALHERFGRLPWPRLFTPAAEVAESGHAVSAFQAGLLRIIQPIITHTEGARALFAPRGALLDAGETLINPGQARLWRLLAEGGMEAWRNEVWPALLAECGTAAGGHLREEDLHAYRPHWRMPLTVELPEHDARIWLNPPPAASGVLIALAFDWLRRHTDESTENLPRACALALRHADTLRRKAEHDLARLIANLPRAWRGTTHISVIDAHGSVCAMTISNGEGNGHLLADFGFMPDNMLGEEDVNPAGAADFPEDVRLSSMMAPTLAETANDMFIALGSGGSNRIRSALLLVLARLLLAGQSLEQAVSAPRLHVENDMLDVEPGLPPGQLEGLLTDFPEHRVWTQHSMFFGGVHAVARTPAGTLHATGDFRRDGATLLA